MIVGMSQLFDAGEVVPQRGNIRTGVWDRFTTWGESIKEGQETAFDEETCAQMVRNFVSRGVLVPMDHNHQTYKTGVNGQPARSLARYAALAVVRGGEVVNFGVLKGYEVAPPDPVGRGDGIYGYRAEVTPYGQDILPDFKYISPAFNPAGQNEQGEQIGYVLECVAATDVPFQGDRGDGPPRLTFHRRTKMSYIMVGNDAYSIDTPSELAEAKDAMRNAGMRQADVWAGEPDGMGDSYRTSQKVFLSLMSGGAMNPELMQKMGMADGMAPAEQMACMTRYAMEASPDDLGMMAAHLEGMGDEKAKQMASKMRSMAKMAVDPAEMVDKDVAKPHVEPDADDKAMMEAEKEKAEMATMEAVARRLGVKLPAGATKAQMMDAISAATVPSADISKIVSEQVKRELNATREKETRAQAEAKAKALYDAVIEAGAPEGNAKALMSLASDPKHYTAAEDTARRAGWLRGDAGPRSILFERMTFAGAPRDIDNPRYEDGALLVGGRDSRIVRNALATWQITGERFSKMAQEWADAKQGAVKMEIDGMMGDHEREHSGLRLIAANNLLRKKQPQLFEAAEAINY